MKTLVLLLCLALQGRAQTIQITAGPAIAPTATAQAWISGTSLCTGYQQAAPVTAFVAFPPSSTVVPTPPASALQNELYGMMTCTISALTPNGSYLFTYVGAETYWNGENQRVFSLSANGAALFTDLDLYAASGGQNIAIPKTYTVTATAAGTIVLTFTATVNQPKFDALIVAPAPPPIPVAATIATDSNGTTTITIPAGSKNTMTGCSVALAGSTYVLFAPQGP